MAHKHSYLALALVSLGLVFLGCGSLDGPTEPDDAALSASLADEGKADSVTSTSTFYKFRHDNRRCVSPVCGGFWVSRVNFTVTKCVDGTWQSECYVPEIDRSAVGTGPDLERATIYRGNIKPWTYGSFGNLGKFAVTEAWAPATARAPTGTFYRVTDSGIRCVRAPCPSLHEAKLNSTTSANITELNFNAVGATAAQIEAARAALVTGGFLAAGTNRAQNGGTALAIGQLYLRVRGVVGPLACTFNSDCTMSSFPRPIASTSDCYCPGCSTTAMNLAVSDANAASWTRICSTAGLRCPMIRCIRPPEVACVNNQCVAQAVP